MAQTEKKQVFRAGDITSQLTSRTNMRTPPMPDGTLFGNPSNLTHRGTGFTPDVPVNNVAPSLGGLDASGNARVGIPVTCRVGAWTPEVRTFTRQWQKAGVDITGAVGHTYTPVTGDIGAAIRCVMTATNSAGSASANSNASGNVAA